MANILVVDDDRAVRSAVSHLLDAEGYSVRLAASPEAGLELLAGEAFDLLIVDLHFPKGDGLQMLERVAALERPIPVIVLTGYPTVVSAIQALRLGAVDYVMKPGHELVERVNAALARRGELPQSNRDARQMEWALQLRELAGRLEQDIPGGSASESSQPPSAAEGLSANYDALSERERQVGELLATGVPVSRIAKRLFISPYTVRNHLRSIFRKVGVHSQVELIHHWQRQASRLAGGHASPEPGPEPSSGSTAESD